MAAKRVNAYDDEKLPARLRRRCRKYRASDINRNRDEYYVQNVQNKVHSVMVNTVMTPDRANSNDRADDKEAGPFRTALPQILACMAKNMLLFDLGLALGFSTVVIPVLRGMQHERNPDETLYFTAEQSSWFGRWQPTSYWNKTQTCNEYLCQPQAASYSWHSR